MLLVPAFLAARRPGVSIPLLNSSSLLSAVAHSSTASASSSISAPSSSSSSFDPRVLPYLACPLSKGELRYEAPHLISVITQDNEEAGQRRVIRVAYPIEQGVPVLLQSRGRILDETVEALQPP